MNAPGTVSIVSAHRQRVLTGKRDHPRFGHGDAGQLGERHRRVLNERYVDGFTIEELDDPLRSANVDERLRLGPAETAAGLEHLAFEATDRCPGADLVDDFAEFLRLLQPWQRTLGTRSVTGLRCRYTQRTKAVVARIVQILHEGEASGLIKVLNDTLTPAIRASIVNGTDSHALPTRQLFHVREHQVFAQREATGQPVGSIPQANTLARADEAQLANVARHSGVGQEP